MRNRTPVVSFFSLHLFTALISLTASFGQAQIKYTNAFPGVTFHHPVYFGVFPGKAKTYVVLEQHKGHVLLLTQKGTAWVKDTLFSLPVHHEWEMGLLGIAFHPDFVKNRRYFISYDPPFGSNEPPVNFANIVEERLVDATLLKDSGVKGVEIFNITDKYRNHNGGSIGFGPNDGFLYYGTGDGGSGGDPDGNGLNKEVLLGKMLRIDINRKDTIKVNGKDSVFNYGIPSKNPFAITGGRKEIFAYGLRNPWTWSFDPLNGDLWTGDVGQGTFEEVDILVAGGNYGWKAMEGPMGTNNGSMILPIFSYPRNEGICVIGGFVYRATNSKYNGSYFVADMKPPRLWSLKKNGTGLATVTEEPDLPTAPSAFGLDERGRIYFCGHGTGIIYLLDSPDLAGSTVGVTGGADFSKLPHRNVFNVSPGSILDASLFSEAKTLQIFSVEGGLITSLRRESAQLPKQIKSGVYFLRSDNKTGNPDLLVVQ